MKGKTNLSKFSRGFTILELVATIGILAALTAISVPTYKSVRDKLDIKNCNQNKYIIFKTYQNEHELDDNVTLKDVIRDSYFMSGRGRQGGLFFNSRIQCNGENYVYSDNGDGIVNIADIHCNHHEGRLADGSDLFNEYESVYNLFTPKSNAEGTMTSGGSYSADKLKDFLSSNSGSFTQDQKDIYQDALDRGLFDNEDTANEVIKDIQAAGEDEADFNLVTKKDEETGETQIILDFSNMNYGDGSDYDLSKYAQNGRVDVAGIEKYMKNLYDSGALNDEQKAAYEAYGHLSKDDQAVRAYLAIIKYKGQMPYIEVNGQKYYVSQTLANDQWNTSGATDNIATIAQSGKYESSGTNANFILYNGQWYSSKDGTGKEVGNSHYKTKDAIQNDINKGKLVPLNPQPNIVTSKDANYSK